MSVTAGFVNVSFVEMDYVNWILNLSYFPNDWPYNSNLPFEFGKYITSGVTTYDTFDKTVPTGASNLPTGTSLMNTNHLSEEYFGIGSTTSIDTGGSSPFYIALSNIKDIALINNTGVSTLCKGYAFGLAAFEQETPDKAGGFGKLSDQITIASDQTPVFLLGNITIGFIPGV